MDAMNKDTLKQYFNLLEDTLKENDLMNCSMKLYNVDETDIPLNPKTPRIVREQEKYDIRALEKGQITVVARGNTARQVLPPLIIFDVKNIRQAG